MYLTGCKDPVYLSGNNVTLEKSVDYSDGPSELETIAPPSQPEVDKPT